LSQTRKLPFWFHRIDFQPENTRYLSWPPKIDLKVVIHDCYTRFIKRLKIWCATDKSKKSWSIEYYGVIEEEGKEYIQVVELRDINPGHKVLQVFGATFELQRGESGKNSTWRQR
jgi:hypothetical protein